MTKSIKTGLQKEFMLH